LEVTRLPDEESVLRRSLGDKSLRRLHVSNVVVLESVDSTQSYAADELRSADEGDIVIGKMQVAGKGRDGRVWYSQNGGLWMTITLLPPTSKVLGSITAIATESIVKTFQDFGVANFIIKPPNDVYYNGRKIAGVLADAVIQGTKSIVYLGMGINVNNDPSEIESISESATSLSRETGHEESLTKFAMVLVENLDRCYDKAIRDEIA
jgi:BirA family transcriptional regulator, biotin operon repressor / biotin---[acetyl-CoA-carboxylase] ligase